MFPTLLLSLALTAGAATTPLIRSQASDQATATASAVDETQPVDVPAPSEAALQVPRQR